MMAGTSGGGGASAIGGASGVFMGIGAGLQFGGNLTSAYSARLAGQGQAWNYKQQAKRYLLDAKDAMLSVGGIQYQSQDAMAMRYDQLARDVAQMRTQAAASGIDLSSDAASRIERANRTYAAWDVARLAEQGQSEANAAVLAARNARIESAYAKANAEIARIGAKMQYKAGMVSAWAGLIGGTAQAAGMSYMGVSGGR